MLASFLITFREGLEAFLIIGILFSYLHQLEATRYYFVLFLGIFAGLITSLGAAYVFQVVISEFDQEEYQHYLMAGVLFSAVFVLTYMVIWMNKQSKSIASNLQKDLKEMVSAGNLIGIFALAFLAILREGIETVLFLSVLSYSGQGNFSAESGMMGAGLGLVLSAILVWSLFQGVKRIPLKEFFKYSGFLILIIAAGLFASAINMLQAVHVMPIIMEKLFDISFLLNDQVGIGIFLRALFGYNATPTLLQFLCWIGYLSTATFLWKRSYAQ